MAARQKKKYPDLRYKFIRGLLDHEAFQRQRHFLKSGSEWTSKAIVSLDLCSHPIKSVSQAARLEGIGAETMRHLKEYERSSVLSGGAPPHGRYLTSASAILVVMSQHRELQSEGRMRKHEIREWAQPVCEEIFLFSSNNDDTVALCPAMWRLEVLVKRGFVQKRTLNKEPIYELTELGMETAARLRGQAPPLHVVDSAPLGTAVSAFNDGFCITGTRNTMETQGHSRGHGVRGQGVRSNIHSKSSTPASTHPNPELSETDTSGAEYSTSNSCTNEKVHHLKKSGGTIRRTLIANETFDPLEDILGQDGDTEMSQRHPMMNSGRFQDQIGVRRNAKSSTQNDGRSNTPHQQRTFLGEPHSNAILQERLNILKQKKEMKKKKDLNRRGEANEMNGYSSRKQKKKEENEEMVDPQLSYLYTNDDGTDGLVLVIDARELGGDGTSLGEMVGRIERKGLRYRTQHLKVGDYCWIMRCGQREVPLPLLIERKRADDLAHSLKDGRYHKQKAKMMEWKQQYLRQHGEFASVQYWVEGDPARYVVRCADRCGALVKCGYPTLDQIQDVLNELASSEDSLVHTEDLAGTVQLLKHVTAEMQYRIDYGEFDALLAGEFSEATLTEKPANSKSNPDVTMTNHLHSRKLSGQLENHDFKQKSIKTDATQDLVCHTSQALPLHVETSSGTAVSAFNDGFGITGTRNTMETQGHIRGHGVRGQGVRSNIHSKSSTPASTHPNPELSETDTSGAEFSTSNSSPNEKVHHLKKSGGTIRRTLIANETFDPLEDILGEDGDKEMSQRQPMMNSGRFQDQIGVRRNAKSSTQNDGRSKTPHQQRPFLGEPHSNAILQERLNILKQKKEMKKKKDLKRRGEANEMNDHSNRKLKKKEENEEMVDPQLSYLYTNDDGTDGLVLVIDARELGGDGTSLGEMVGRIERKGLRYRTQHLKVGDYCWIMRCGRQEVPLPLLIERKRADDLAHSLKDGRYHKQKAKMMEWKQQYLRQHGEFASVQYWVEGDPARYVVRCADRCGSLVKCGYPTLDQIQDVLNELASSEDMSLVHTEDLAGTVQLLKHVTTEMQYRIDHGEFDALLAGEFSEATLTKKATASKSNPDVTMTNHLHSRKLSHQLENHDFKQEPIKTDATQVLTTEIIDFKDFPNHPVDFDRKSEAKENPNEPRNDERPKPVNKFMARYRQRVEREREESVSHKIVKTPRRNKQKKQLNMSPSGTYITDDEVSVPKCAGKTPATKGSMSPRSRALVPSDCVSLARLSDFHDRDVLSKIISAIEQPKVEDDGLLSSGPLMPLECVSLESVFKAQDIDIPQSKQVKESGNFSADVDNAVASTLSSSRHPGGILTPLSSDSDSDSLPDLGLTPKSQNRDFDLSSTSSFSVDRFETAEQQQYKVQLEEVRSFVPDVNDQTALELLCLYAGNVEAVVTTIFEEASQQ